MASNRSQSLIKFAESLRLYNPNNNSFDGSSNNINTHNIQNQSQKIKETGTDQVGNNDNNNNNNNSTRSISNRAAVLVCLFEDQQGQLRVILTKRASTLSLHSGEVALPGGKVEEDDADDIETALREAEEEIGLDRSLVDVVTVLESLPARNRITVIPVVGILWDRNAFNPVINTAEVEAIFDAPLEMFLKDENRREKEIKYMGDEYLIHFFDHETENGKFMIWALTAGILIKTASIVYQRPPDFQVRMPRFWNRSRQ
ncbi:Nudix hydrolase 22, chloroplastic [Capsicum baccatum]|uniref:Nudix hydrolase 22, chloroplastic n=1 Tax=Capsicum baccatum TaxID=33114 RepID=A0A2G2VS05_CAPBA|nr:Nudix hydrolase 22, chloroplastic [Capsicum baccatum]